MNDIIGGMDMHQGALTTFAADRFGNANSALNLNGGFTYVPPGVYFNSAFTISAWVYLEAVGDWARLIDFGNDQSTDNVILTLGYRPNFLQPTLFLFFSPTSFYDTTTSIQLPERIWHFLTATFDGNYMKIYINGTLTSSYALSTYTIPNNVNRDHNYIGKSSIASDGYSSSLVDDLRIYNRCLNVSEIQKIMINTV